MLNFFIFINVEITNMCMCVLDRGTVFAVGCNVNGQLGIGTQCPTVLKPVRVCLFLVCKLTLLNML